MFKVGQEKVVPAKKRIRALFVLHEEPGRMKSTCQKKIFCQKLL